MGSADSGVEPGNPIFNVPTPGLLRVTAYLLMSRKAPSYPSPYIDSTLTAVEFWKSSLLSVNNTFLKSTKGRRKKPTVLYKY